MVELVDYKKLRNSNHPPIYKHEIGIMNIVSIYEIDLVFMMEQIMTI